MEREASLEHRSELTDRLGRHADVENGWFGRRVEFWRTAQGVRQTTFELDDLGRRLVEDVGNGRADVPRAVLGEVEGMLAWDDDPVGHHICLELLEGLDSEILEWPKHHPVPRQVLVAILRDLMGPATRLAWSEVDVPRSGWPDGDKGSPR